MRKSYREENGEKVFRYSIRKCHFGAASVAVAALMFFANGAVKADTLPVSSATANTEKVNDSVTELAEGLSTGLKDNIEPKAAIEPKADTEGLPTGLKNNIESKVETEPKAVTEGLSTGLKDAIEPKAATEGVLTGLKDNVESKVQTTGLQEKVSALQSEVNRIRANEKHKAQIEQAEKLIKEVNDLQASKTATQKEVDAKVKEIKSLTFILKSMKAEENVKPKKNQDSRNGKKMVKGTGFRIGEGTTESTPSIPQPEGNVIAHGEDGVPWELYGNGYLLFKPEVGKDTLTNNSGESTWKDNYGEQIKHVGFAGKVYAPENSRYIFSKYSFNSNKIDRKFNPSTFDTMHFDTSKVRNMNAMFNGMSNLTNLDVTHFDTSKVTNMEYMFNGMSNLTNLDVTHFDTSKVTSMAYMFGSMFNLTNLDVTHFDTSKVTNMNAMFLSMRNLTNLDVTHFDTSKVTNMSFMFANMPKLINLDVTHFNTSEVTNMSTMFTNMSNLTNLDVTNFDTSKVTNMDSMLGGTGKLKELKLGDKFKADGIRTIPTTHSYGNQYTDKWHKVEDKERLYTVSDWADAYAGNSTATAGTWVREVSNATLTFQGENFTPVKVTPSDTALPTLSRPSQPKQNHKFLGWSKDGTNLLTRDAVQPGETINLQPLWQPVNNTTTRTERIPIATIYRADGTIPFESRQEVAGQEGVKTITTTYTVAPYTGELTDPVESERVTTEMQPKVIKVGNKKVVTESIPATNRYVGNTEKDRGYSNLTTQGQDGLRTITTTYTVNETTGNLSDPSTSETSTPMTQNVYEVGTKPKVLYGKEGNKVVKTTTTYVVDPTNGNVTEASAKETISEDGAKDKVVTEDIEPKVVYEKDDSREKDSENITTPGQKGSKVTTTTYTVNENTGAVEEHVGEPVITPATNTVVKVAAKDKVTYKKQGDNVVKTTTVYTVNPENGNITEVSTDEVTQPNGAKDKVVTEDIEPKVVYEKDDSREKDSENITTPGQKGSKVTTTTYTVNENTGALEEHPQEPVITPATNTVVKVAAKDKVTYKKQGDNVVKTTTVYTVNPENGNITEVSTDEVTQPNGAKDNAVTPAAKTKVANPEKLSDAEKKAIEDKVKAANPGAEVVVDDKGKAAVVKDGNVSVIPSTDLVKVQDDAKKDNGGNDANTPAAKTVVADKESLTPEEKAAVKKAVEAVNSGSTVVVDDKGNATVTKADGTVLNIPSTDLVIPATNLADEATNAKVKTPVTRTLVGAKENLTKDAKEAVKKAIEAVNSGAIVVVDNQGNATVTLPDGSTATISKEQLVKDKEAVSKSKHGGDNLDIDLSKVEVTNLADITPEEKAKFQFKVLGAITDVEEFDLDAYIKSTEDGKTVYKSKDGKVKITIDKDGNATATVEKDGKKEVAVNIDKAGNVTIVTKEGQVLAIPRDDAFKQRPYVPSNGGGNNGAANTDAKVDKAKLEGAIHQLDELIIKESAKLDAETAKEATDLLADAKKVFANADATQAEVDAMVKRIEDFMAKVAPATDHATPAKDQAAQTPAPATTQAAVNASQEAATNARKAAKELPNTGTADSTVAMVAAAASALLGLGLAGRRRKEDEEA